MRRAPRASCPEHQCPDADAAHHDAARHQAEDDGQAPQEGRVGTPARQRRWELPGRPADLLRPPLVEHGLFLALNIGLFLALNITGRELRCSLNLPVASMHALDAEAS